MHSEEHVLGQHGGKLLDEDSSSLVAQPEDAVEHGVHPHGRGHEPEFRSYRGTTHVVAVSDQDTVPRSSCAISSRLHVSRTLPSLGGVKSSLMGIVARGTHLEFALLVSSEMPPY